MAHLARLLSDRSAREIAEAYPELAAEAAESRRWRREVLRRIRRVAPSRRSRVSV